MRCIFWKVASTGTMNIPAKFQLYEKIGDSGEWKLHKTAEDSDAPIIAEINSTDGTQYGASYTRNFRTGNTSSSTNAELLKDVNATRYYGIRFTSISNVAARETWSGKVEMQVQAIAGSSLSALHNLAVSSMPKPGFSVLRCIPTYTELTALNT